MAARRPFHVITKLAGAVSYLDGEDCYVLSKELLWLSQRAHTLRRRCTQGIRHTAAVGENLLDLCVDAPTATYPDGAVLLAEGNTPGRLLVLQSGSVTVERDGVPFARMDTPGSVFGEMSAVLGKPASATVRASAETTVRVIDDPEAFLRQQPGAALAVLRMTASRLDGLTQYLVDVKQQFAGLEGHLGMVDSILDTLVHHQGPAVRPGSARDPEG